MGSDATTRAASSGCATAHSSPSPRRLRRSRRTFQHRQGGLGGQRLPLGAGRGGPEGEGLAEPYPPARRTQSSAGRAPEVGQHDALEGALVSSMYSATGELDGWQDRAHYRHRAGEVQDRHYEPRLQYPVVQLAKLGPRLDRGLAIAGDLIHSLIQQAIRALK
jgi:hypothetical protein